MAKAAVVIMEKYEKYMRDTIVIVFVYFYYIYELILKKRGVLLSMKYIRIEIK